MNATEIINHEFDNNYLVHAYLILGDNADKTNEIFSLIKERTKCLDVDVTDIVSDDSSGKSGEIKTESIKNFLHEINLSPSGNLRIAVIRNAEKLNTQSANRLLKALEEPLGEVIFILMAKNDSVISTIKSRCQILRIPDKIERDYSEYIKVLESGFFESSTMIENIVKENQVGEFIDSLESYFRDQMLSDLKSNKDVFKNIAIAKRQIANNANARLALESLIVRLYE